MSVEFVAESAPAWAPLHTGTVGFEDSDVAGFVATAPFIPDREGLVPASVFINAPAFLPDAVRLPSHRRFRSPWWSPATWLRRLPRRSARQLVESAAAVVLILILSPLLIAVSVAIKLTSRGPVQFRQERVGLHRKPFTIYKFRTMHVDNDDSEHRRLMRAQLVDRLPPDGGQPGIFKIANDPRVTLVGRFLRQTSIDELPQLFNVLRGEMSLVGPRPYVPWEAELFPPEVEKRFGVRPGMTGLWQVSGRSTVDYRTALTIDVYYTENKSLWLDLRILARTVAVIFDRSLTR